MRVLPGIRETLRPPRLIFYWTLQHQREPTLFIQFEGRNVGAGTYDAAISPDVDGHATSATRCYELMPDTNVRILVSADTDKATAVALVKKLAGWMEQMLDEIRDAKEEVHF